MPDASQIAIQELPSEMLTPDLARSMPDQYLLSLFHNFQTQTTFGAVAFAFVTKYRGVTKEKITINPDTWHSRHDMNEGTIRLGAKEMDEQDKTDNFPFEANDFTYTRILYHILAHELAHFIGEAAADQIDEKTNARALNQYEAFMNSFACIRENGLGLTTHAGTQRYIEKGTGIQAVEDMTDLLAMFIVDPEYLQRYLNFLANPIFQERRTKLKLITLAPGLPDAIFKNISSVFAHIVQ